MTPDCRLIAIDLDGTLLNSKKSISPQDREALFDAERMGVALAVISGRRFAELEALTTGLPDGLFRAGHGGALIRRASRTIAETPLPREAAAAAARLVLTTDLGRGLTLLVSERDGGVRVTAREPSSARVARYLTTVRPAPRFEPSPRFSEDPLHAVLAGNPADCRAAEVLLREALSDRVSLERTEYTASGLGLLDVLAAGAGKGAALARIAAETGIPMGATLAIGDNWNDLEMLRAAGVGVLMENAEPELKRCGFRTTRSHDDHGVAAVIRGLLSSRG